jgi:hypothetical protein
MAENSSLRARDEEVSPHDRPLRVSVRMATLRSLVGKDQRNPGESLNQYWMRVQSLELKLSLLRGGGKMPWDEEILWKQLWNSCHLRMEEVVVELKQLIHSPLIGKTSELQADAIDGGQLDADESILGLAQQIAGTIVTSSLARRLDEVAWSHRLQRDSDERETSFARPLSRAVRSGAFERDFEERGLDAIRSRLEAPRSATPTVKSAKKSSCRSSSPVASAADTAAVSHSPAAVRISGGWASVVRPQGRAEDVRPPPMMTVSLMHSEQGHSFQGCAKEQQRCKRTVSLEVEL